MLDRGPGVGAEARAGDLEDVAQALGGDAHVVQRLDLRGVGRARHERAQLVEAHAHDALGVVGQRRGGIEALDLAGLHRAYSASAASASPRSRSRSPFSRACASASARASLPAAWRARRPRDDGLHAAALCREHALGERVHGVDVDVGVAALAERVRQRLDVAERLLERLVREARREDLEHGAQAPRGDPHVVHALDVARVEHARPRGRRAPRCARARPARRRRRRAPRGGSRCPSASPCLSRRRRPAPAGRPRGSRRLPIRSGRPNRCEAASRISMPAGQQPDARRVEREAVRDLLDRLAGQHAQGAAPACRGRAPPPTRRRSDAALPPTATAHSGRGISRPSKTPCACSRSARSSSTDGGSEWR